MFTNLLQVSSEKLTEEFGDRFQAINNFRNAFAQFNSPNICQFICVSFKISLIQVVDGVENMM